MKASDALVEIFLFLDELMPEPHPSVKVSRESFQSYWNMDTNTIVIGLGWLKNPDVDNRKIILGLTLHELGHVRWTEDLKLDEKRKRGEEIPPFPLINILDDQMIETRWIGEKPEAAELFRYVLETAYRHHYNGCLAPFLNSYNIGVVLRMKRMGVYVRELETEKEKLQYYFGDSFETFLKDWEEALEKAERANSTEEVFEIALELYRKHRDLFDQEEPNTSCFISPEAVSDKKDAECGEKEMFGKREVEQDKEDREELVHGLEPYVNPELSPLRDIPVWKGGNRTFWNWNEVMIKREATILRRYLQKPAEEKREYSMSGKRVKIRRLPLPHPEKFIAERKLLRRKDLKVLCIVDYSGSMSRDPVENAGHVVRIIHATGMVDWLETIVCSTEFCYRVYNPKKLNTLLTAGGEGFIQFKYCIPPNFYDFVVVFSDLHIEDRSVEVLLDIKKTYHRRLIGVYVGDPDNVNRKVAEIFPVFIHSYSVGGIARLLGLHLLKILQ